MILIVGATGYVGRYLSVTLKEQGKEVLALGRNPKVEEFFESEGVPFQHFDLLCDADYDLLPKEGIEAVINLAVCLPEHEVPLERFLKSTPRAITSFLNSREEIRLPSLLWPARTKFIVTSMLRLLPKRCCRTSPGHIPLTS